MLSLYETVNTSLFGSLEPIGVTPFVPNQCVRCSGLPGAEHWALLLSWGTMSSAFAEFLKILLRTS